MSQIWPGCFWQGWRRLDLVRVWLVGLLGLFVAVHGMQAVWIRAAFELVALCCLLTMGALILQNLDGRCLSVRVEAAGLRVCRFFRPTCLVPWRSVSMVDGEAGHELRLPHGSIPLEREFADWAGLSSAISSAKGRAGAPDWVSPAIVSVAPSTLRLCDLSFSLQIAGLYLLVLVPLMMRPRIGGVGGDRLVLLRLLAVAVVVTCALLYHRTFRAKLTERALELLHRQYVLPPLGLADLEVVRETTRGIHLRCGLIRMVLPLRNAAERRFALQVKEAITAAKRRLAESEVVL